jgi:hypothetical protein
MVALLSAAVAAQPIRPSPDSPRIDRIEVTGAERTPRTVVVDALGLEPQQVLTPASLARARRRLQALPALDDAGVQYTERQGHTTVEAVVSEGAAYPHGVVALAALTARPIFARDLQVDFAGASGWGERWTVAFRWPDERRRVKAAFSVPAPGALPGVLTLEGRWGRQTYDVDGGEGGAVFREERRRGFARLADWATGWLGRGRGHRQPAGRDVRQRRRRDRSPARRRSRGARLAAGILAPGRRRGPRRRRLRPRLAARGVAIEHA